MSDFQARLRDAVLPDGVPGPTIEAARRAVDDGRARRRRKLSAVSAVALAAVVVASAGAIAGGRGSASVTRLTARPAVTTSTPSTSTSTSTTTTPEDAGIEAGTAAPPTPTTGPAGGRSPATGARSAGVPPATTKPQAPDPPEDADGPASGLWVVGTDGKGLRRLSPDDGPVTWSPDGATVAKAHDDVIWFLPLQDGRPAATLAVEAPGATCLDWSSKGELAWVTSTGDLRVSRDLKQSRVIAGSAGGQCTWSHDGSMIAVLACCDAASKGLTIYDRDGHVVARREDATITHWTRWIDKVAWSPDDTLIAVMENSGEVDSRILIVRPAKAAAEDVRKEPPTPGAYAVESLSWDEAGTGVYFQSADDNRQFLLTVADQRMTELPLSCCRLLAALPGGRLLALTGVPVQGFRGDHRGLTVVESDRTTTRTIAVTRGPRSSYPSMSECAGSYITNKWISPDAEHVAFRIGNAWGPRCDSPNF